jgi:hypothetical protein
MNHRVESHFIAFGRSLVNLQLETASSASSSMTIWGQDRAWEGSAAEIKFNLGETTMTFDTLIQTTCVTGNQAAFQIKHN